jgi:hypothetical protein
MAKETSVKTKLGKALAKSETARSVSGSVLRTKAPKGIRSIAASVLGSSPKSKEKKR